MKPTPGFPTLTLSALEERLTPADVVINYFVFFSNAGTSVGTTSTGLANSNLGSTGFTGLNNSNLGTAGFGTGTTATNLVNNNLVGTNTFGSAGTGFNTTAGTTGVGSFGAGVGGSTGGGGGAGSFSTGTTGTGSLNTLNTGLTSTAGGGTNTLNSFNSNGFSNNNFGTGFGTGGTFTNGLNTTGGVTGIGTGNAFNTSNNTNNLVGSTGFAFNGANGVTITTTITPNGVTRTTTSGTSTGNGTNGFNTTGTTTSGTSGTVTGGTTGAGTNMGGGGTNTNATAAEIQAARGERRAVFTEDGSVGVLLNPFPNYAGELRTAVADVTGDGVADTVVAPGVGGGPRVAVFDGRTGEVVADFFAYDDALRNGVTVGAGDLDGDGRAEVVTGAGPGGGPRVRAFTIGGDGSATRTADFFAFDDSFRGGVTVAVGDADGDGRADILTGAGEGGGPRVDAFTPAGENLRSLFVGDPNGRGGAAIGGTVRTFGRTLLAVGGPAAQLFDAATGELVRTLDDGAAGPTTVSVGRGVLNTPQVRVARAGEVDRVFDLNGVEVS